MIDSILWNQFKPLKANNMKWFNESYFQITVFTVTAEVKRNYKLRKGTGKLLPVFNCCFVEKHQHQLRILSWPDSHESGGMLFGRL